MPITKSAKRALRKAEKNRIHNLAIKNQLKKGLKDAYVLIKKKDKNAGKAVSRAVSLFDKAAKKKIISKQRAARIKSRLSKLLSRAKLKPEKREIVKPVIKAKKSPAKKEKAKLKKTTPEKKKAKSNNKSSK